ncbi:MAG TPA: Gfo/Idh/MocA family oxidoreductase [Chloroflexota bacterium]|nr:Gfo/Idh/MocA family oxidoreductase [Chloroflexota bacterium]
MRFGIVGCGVIAPTHADAINSLPGAVLAAVADSNLDRARALGERYGVPAYGSLREMLAAEDLDIVNICTPSGLHGAGAIEAMHAGRHVIVEKPMDITPAALEEMQRVQQETGRVLSVISQHRFDDASQRVHQQAESGALGRLVLGVAQVPWWRGQSYYDSGEWRGTYALDGGGILMNQAIHTIDLLLWMMGPVQRVVAYTDTLAHEMEAEDVAVASLRFASGALGAIVATTAAYPGVTTRLEIFGDRGSAVIERDRLAYLQTRGEDEPLMWGRETAEPEVPADEGDRPGHAAQIADVMRAIRDGTTPLVDATAGRRAVELILAIYESSRTGREITL